MTRLVSHPVARPCRTSAKVLLAGLLWLLNILASAFPLSVAAQDPDTATGDGHASPSQNPASPADSQLSDLSDEIIRDVLSSLQRGMEAHNLDLVLSVFDPDAMPNYPRFHDQMLASFRLHDQIRFRYQLLQVAGEKDTAFAVADIDMATDSDDILATSQHRSTQLRFQLKRTPQGWRIIGLKPAEFLTQ